MKNDVPAAKIQEFDLLRALAIIMLMFHHSEAYGLRLFGFPLAGLTPYFEAILLGIFFFISGYLTERSFQKRNNGGFSFFFSRMLRIYPPYLLAVFLYMFILEITLKKLNLIVYFNRHTFYFRTQLRQTCCNIVVHWCHHFVLPYLRFTAGKYALQQGVDHRFGAGLCRRVCTSPVDRLARRTFL